jgi:hypothetical protein
MTRTRTGTKTGTLGMVAMGVVVTVAAVGCDAGAQRLGWTFEPGPSASNLPGDTFRPWAGGPAYYRRWSRGPSPDPAYFPLSVWMQNPDNARRFAEVGIDSFTGLWMGPTDAQLLGLGEARLSTFCEQTGVWSEHLNDATITAWMQPDGPDNAQENASGGYDPCVPPATVRERYDNLVANDRTRPIYLGLGQGVADTQWVGRGTCTGQTEMYADYAEGGDLLSFHIYPHNDSKPLELVAAGVENLRTWSGARKPINATIEASDINGGARPSPADLAAEVWMALVHDASSIQYYCHRFMPDFSETDCLDDAPTAAALAAINGRIRALAPVLNVPSVANGVEVASSAADVPVDVMLKRHAGATYLFAVAMRGTPTRATFTLRALPARARVEVLDENRQIAVTAAATGVAFSDDFAGYGVHLYRVTY